MSTFVNRDPVEVLLDYQDELDHEILTAEQRAERYADDYRRANQVRAWMEVAKRLRATRRKNWKAIGTLREATAKEPKVEPV